MVWSDVQRPQGMRPGRLPSIGSRGLQIRGKQQGIIIESVSQKPCKNNKGAILRLAADNGRGRST
eukprot:scaffold45838_cov35-Prasinocladus_malaysianus.AAC.1